MVKHLIICGHGQGRTSYDPGAVGPKGTEADWVRKLANAMRRYSVDIDYIVDKNVYDCRNILDYKNYTTITELHLNAFNGIAKGCEVLIHSKFSADNLDKGLLNILSKYFSNRGIKKRDNLYNMNVAANNNMNYRLVEVCFVDNVDDMNILEHNLDVIAQEFVQVISGKIKQNAVTQSPQPQVGLKSLDEVAREVLNGRWGNGKARIQNLTQAGYDAVKVQERVNQIKGTPTKKTVDEIAREVLNGKWGNGQDRVNRLRNAGYNPQEIQNRVNQLVR